jgi:hypothetical protein
MADNSVVIKNTVKLVNQITASKDTRFDEDETRYLVTTLLGELCDKFNKSPKMVAAILQHLHDCGFDVTNGVKSENTFRFIETFGTRINSLNDIQIQRVREINNALFNVTA